MSGSKRGGWFILDNGITEHPKFVGLGSSDAMVLWLHGLAYCSRNLTDGFVPMGMMHRLAPIDPDELGDAVRALVRAELWDEVPGGFVMHDYLDYQRSRAQVQKERQQARARQDRARRKRQNGGSGAVDDDEGDVDAAGDSDLSRRDERRDERRSHGARHGVTDARGARSGHNGPDSPDPSRSSHGVTNGVTGSTESDETGEDDRGEGVSRRSHGARHGDVTARVTLLDPDPDPDPDEQQLSGASTSTADLMAAAEQIAAWRGKRAEADTKRNPSSWYAGALSGIVTELRTALDHHQGDPPTTITALAELIEPKPTKPPPAPDADCPSCSGSGWAIEADGPAERCPTCLTEEP